MPSSSASSGVTASMPGPWASLGINSTQPGRIRLAIVSLAPSGWTRSLFSSKISRYRRPSSRWFCAISHSDSWNRPTGGLTRYTLSEFGACATGGRAANSAAEVSGTPGLACADTECGGLGGPVLATAGANAAAAVNSSSAAVTSRWAADWVGPASGTRDGTPTLLTAALTSTSTHQTSCTQASQITTDRMRRIAVISSWLVSMDSSGLVCGRPTTRISAIGTPIVSAVSTTMAATPASTSPGVRRLILTGCLSPGIGGAISTPSAGQRCRRPDRPSPTPTPGCWRTRRPG